MRAAELLDGRPQVIDNELGELVAPVVGAQQFLIINLPHDQAIKVVEQGV